MLRPGSLVWLLAWDLRLAGRGFRRRPGTKARTGLSVLLTLFVLLVFMHAFGASVVFMIRLSHPGESAQLLLLTTALSLALASAVASALTISVNLLFVRNDLELLCSTPVPMRSVFTARSLSIALRSIAVPAMLLLPAANIAAFFNGLHWLAAYPVVFSAGLSASAIGLALTLVLVRLVGAQAARTIALVLSVVVGAAAVLGLQGPNLLDEQQKRALFSAAAQWLNSSSIATTDSWTWYPARALRGELMPLLVTVAVGILLFQLSVWLLPRGFAVALRQSAQVGSSVTTRTSPFQAHFFGVLFGKEWRTLYRDPQLLARLLQRFIGLVPGVFLLLRHHEHDSASTREAGMVVAITILVGMLADTLVWLAVCADDAPELLASAPRTSESIRRMKLMAILLPIWAAALALLAALARQSPWILLCSIVCIGGITTSAGMYQLWNPVQSSRKDIRQRHQRVVKPDLARALASLIMYAGWGIFAWGLTAMYWWLCLIALPVALAGPAYAWSRRDEAAELS